MTCLPIVRVEKVAAPPCLHRNALRASIVGCLPPQNRSRAPVGNFDNFNFYMHPRKGPDRVQFSSVQFSSYLFQIVIANRHVCECVTRAALDPNAKGEFGLLFFMFSQVRRGPPRTHHTVSKDGSAPRPRSVSTPWSTRIQVGSAYSRLSGRSMIMLVILV